MNTHGSSRNKDGISSFKFACSYFSFLGSMLFALLMTLTQAAYANPEGGTVVAGEAAIIQSPNYTEIQQTSDKAAINWQSFSIGGQEHTHFQQPSASSVTLNRVIGSDPSAIFGRLSATGRIILLNQAGILFAPGSRVDVAGLIATTANISNQDFIAGNYHFVQPANSPARYVINKGTITASDGGLVALVAPGVENQGVIQANLGKVALASGNEFTVDLNGDQLIQLSVGSGITQRPSDHNGDKMKDAVTNSGTIIANGGRVLLTAGVAEGIVDNVINMKGVINSQTIGQNRGEIILGGGERGIVNVSGQLNVVGAADGTTGGTIKIVGEKVGIFKGANINASGKRGGGMILVGGDYQGKGTLQRAKATYVAREATIKADAIEQGDGGRIVVWSDSSTRAYGEISARGGALGGNGGLIETSGKDWLDTIGARIDASAPAGDNGTWLLDPTDVVITNSSSTGITSSGSDIVLWSPTVSNPTTSIVNTTDIQNALNAGTNVMITTNSGYAGSGNITQNAAINKTSGDTAALTYNAANSITINAAITNSSTSGVLNLFLNAANSGQVPQTNYNNAGGTITVAGAITTLGGGVTIYNTGDVNINNNIITTGSNGTAGTNRTSSDPGDGGAGGTGSAGGLVSITVIDGNLTLANNVNITANGGAGGTGGNGYTPPDESGATGGAGGAGGAGGNIIVAVSNGNFTTNSGDNITSTGGAGGTGGNGDTCVVNASCNLPGGAGGIGGNAGAINVTVSNNADLRSTIFTSKGGAGGTGGIGAPSAIALPAGGTGGTGGAGGVASYINLTAADITTNSVTFNVLSGNGGAGGAGGPNEGSGQGNGGNGGNAGSVTYSGTNLTANSNLSSTDTNINSTGGTGGSGGNGTAKGNGGNGSNSPAIILAANNLTMTDNIVTAVGGSGGAGAIAGISGTSTGWSGNADTIMLLRSQLSGNISVINSANAFRNTANTAAPINFTIRQNDNIADSLLPTLSQFGGSIDGMNYTIQSDLGNITISTASKVNSSALTLNATTSGKQINITSALGLGGMPLASATFNSPTINLPSIISTGAQTYNTSNLLSLNGGTYTTTTGDIALNGPTILTVGTTFNSTSGDIIFNGTIDGDLNTLSVNNGTGNILINNTVDTEGGTISFNNTGNTIITANLSSAGINGINGINGTNGGSPTAGGNGTVGGAITISTGAFSLTNASLLSDGGDGGNGGNNTGGGVGAHGGNGATAGTITLTANSIYLDNATISAQGGSGGNGGAGSSSSTGGTSNTGRDIQLIAANNFTMTDSTINTEGGAGGNGATARNGSNAGSVTLTANSLTMTDPTFLTEGGAGASGGIDGNDGTWSTHANSITLDNTTSGNYNFANLSKLGNTSNTSAPINFTYQQVDSINNQSALPTLSQYTGNNIDGMNYTLQSTSGSVTFVDATNLTGSNLILKAATDVNLSVPVTSGMNLAGLSAIAGNNVLMNNVTTNGNANQSYSAGNTLVLGQDTNLTSNNGTINLTGPLGGAYALTLAAGSGDINYTSGAPASGETSLVVSSVNNLTATGPLTVASYTQTQGSGITNFGDSGLQTNGTISVVADVIRGRIVGGATYLNGISNMNVNVDVASLIINGLNGGTLKGYIAGKGGQRAAIIIQLASEAIPAVAKFTMNNCTVLLGCNISGKVFDDLNQSISKSTIDKPKACSFGETANGGICSPVEVDRKLENEFNLL